MGVLYFTRHGQTYWNVANKICGATDIGLTQTGHDQAIELAKRIVEDGITFDEILYSPLERAADTAEHISEITGVPARREDRLIEQNFGKYEGAARNDPDFQIAKRTFINHYDGGESMFQVAQRVYNLLDSIKKEPDKTYMMVAHNGIARVVQSYFYDMDNEQYSRYGIDNCAVVKYTF